MRRTMRGFCGNGRRGDDEREGGGERFHGGSGGIEVADVTGLNDVGPNAIRSTVAPAKAGTHFDLPGAVLTKAKMDSGLRRNDGGGGSRKGTSRRDTHRYTRPRAVPGARMSAIAADASARSDELFGHPKGLYVCFFTEMWGALLVLRDEGAAAALSHEVPLFSDDNGYNLVGAYGGLVYAMPVIGGLVADRWLGMRKAVVFGGICSCSGISAWRSKDSRRRARAASSRAMRARCSFSISRSRSSSWASDF